MTYKDDTAGVMRKMLNRSARCGTLQGVGTRERGLQIPPGLGSFSLRDEPYA
jgi:hypothetical protein